LGQIKYDKTQREALSILKYCGGSIMLWICLSLAGTGEFVRIKINMKGQSPGRKLKENHFQTVLTILQQSLKYVCFCLVGMA
jgi:hypothetical protein